ncbi:hypothetical protein PAESOLCIP111_04371 [Paenibacillus solanacearum]|uniref:Uncharacterized protein n=1 Tax=Paenibacillus solanacearum TaxID=2048548 RepID=A0A916K7P6_9BACL|nr:CBO0543 family protein [Paenibacillus solanacearum]CAG7642694.1 hypothetical protein PAESOLCIP111_04371 [Paenibacillus solanacearum]
MNWTVERVLLVAVYVISIGAFVLIPAHRRREAHVTFLCQELVTWFLGLVVVENDWIRYPVREMQVGTTSSIVYEYISYPVVTAYFNLYYPRRRKLPVQLAYYVLAVSALTTPEYFIEKYTALIDYEKWHWYYTFLSLSVTLLLSRLFYSLFFREGRSRKDGDSPQSTIGLRE